MSEVHDSLAKAKQIIAALEDELRQADRGLMALTGELETRAAALQESEARFRLLVEGSTEVFFFLHDPEGLLTYISPSVEQVLGHRPEALIGRNRHVVFAKHSRDEVAEQAAEALIGTGARRARYLARVQHPKGHEVWLEVMEQPLEQPGSAIGVQGFARDVTEQVRRQEELRETTRIMNALIAASPAAIFVLDRHARVQLWNPAAERIFGWSAEEVPGELLLSPEDASELGVLMRRTLAGEPVSALDLEWFHVDGARIDIHVATAPLHSSSGEVDGVVTVAVDVSEKRSLQEQLQRAQKMEAIGRLAGGIAHDFNNILTAIKGHADFALDELPAHSSAREEVEEVHRNADRATDLTRRLLAFTRQQVVQPKIVDLAEEVRETQKMLLRIIGEGIRLDTRLAPGRIRIDPGQLHQVVLNLVVNARDAMPDGGHITIEVAPARLGGSDADDLSADPGEYMTLSVHDTGQGMDEATQEHVFEPFFTTKELGRGTGLGLSIVYGIVTSTGGDIQITSAPGEGTRLDLYLPRVFDPLDGDGKTAELGPSGTRDVSGTIMVVEDQPSIRRVIRRILTRKGYDVIDVQGPEEALALSDEELDTVDLILSDLVMPGMSGVELVDRLLTRHPDLKVVFMSGYAQDSMVQQGARLQDTLFLEKPFSSIDLTSKIEEGFRRQTRA